LISDIVGDFGVDYYRKEHDGKFLQSLSISTAKFSEVYLLSLVGDYKRLCVVKDKHQNLKPNIRTLGGRTRTYQLGISENVSCYDYESLYPSIMKPIAYSLLLSEPERISISNDVIEYKKYLKSFILRVIDKVLDELLKYRKSEKGDAFQGLIRKVIDYLQFDDIFILPNSNAVADTKEYIFSEGVISDKKKKDKSKLKIVGVRSSNVLPMNRNSDNVDLFYDVFKDKRQTSFKLFEGNVKGKGVPFNFLLMAITVIDDICISYPKNKNDLSSLKKDYREKYSPFIDDLDIKYCELFKASLTIDERKHDKVYELLHYKRKYAEAGETTRSRACKIIMNSVYGKTANENFIFNNPILSSCITTIARFSHVIAYTN
jgi:hypothetical protein